MNKITKWALYLYLSVLTPFTAMACTSCGDNHNNDLEQMEENKINIKTQTRIMYQVIIPKKPMVSVSR